MNSNASTKELYRAVEHLARICCGRHWEDGHLAMLTAAFDASTSRDGEIVCVAGFVSTAKQWEEFSEKWVARLHKDGLDYFHMHEFVSLQEQFKTWDSTMRRDRGGKLIVDLLEIIQEHAFRKIGCTVIVKFLDEIDPENRRRFIMDKAYALGGRRVGGDVANWCHMEKISYLPKLVFEDGDLGKGDLIDGLRQDGWPIPAFSPKRDRLRNGLIDPAFIPLQAADMIAHTYCGETLEFIATKEDFEGRWRFKQFEAMVGSIGFHSPANLQEMNQTMTIMREQENWAKEKRLPPWN